MTCGLRGPTIRFSKRDRLLITKNFPWTHFYDEFRRETTHFQPFLANFQRKQPMFKENLREKGLPACQQETSFSPGCI